MKGYVYFLSLLPVVVTKQYGLENRLHNEKRRLKNRIYRGNYIGKSHYLDLSTIIAEIKQGFVPNDFLSRI